MNHKTYQIQVYKYKNTRFSKIRLINVIITIILTYEAFYWMYGVLTSLTNEGVVCVNLGDL